MRVISEDVFIHPNYFEVIQVIDQSDEPIYRPAIENYRRRLSRYYLRHYLGRHGVFIFAAGLCTAAGLVFFFGGPQ